MLIDLPKLTSTSAVERLTPDQMLDLIAEYLLSSGRESAESLYRRQNGSLYINRGGATWLWSPHVDDGESARLAARLMINVSHDPVSVTAQHHSKKWIATTVMLDEPDRSCAMRRSVLVVAAKMAADLLGLVRPAGGPQDRALVCAATIGEARAYAKQHGLENATCITPVNLREWLGNGPWRHVALVGDWCEPLRPQQYVEQIKAIRLAAESGMPMERVAPPSMEG